MKFSEFVELANQEIIVKQERLGEILDSEKLSFSADDIGGRIRFASKITGKVAFEFDMALVGSYNCQVNTWQWAWGRQDLEKDDALALIRQVSALAEAFPEEKQFVNPRPFEVEKTFGQDVAAALVKLLDADGIHRAYFGADSEYEIYRVIF